MTVGAHSWEHYNQGTVWSCIGLSPVYADSSPISKRHIVSLVLDWNVPIIVDSGVQDLCQWTGKKKVRFVRSQQAAL